MIVRNSDNVVIYDDTWALTANGATRNGVWDRATTTGNATQIDGQTLPEYWTGGAYSWTEGGGFVVADQSLADAAKVDGAPASISRVQLRLALQAVSDQTHGDQWQHAIAVASAAGGEAQARFEEAREFGRANPLLIAQAGALGYDTPVKIADLFIAASKL
ncbi:MAG: hypothetical protein NXI16_01225 [Alphaproteobacteria bacterium]|nr:hypothetical protein [Alphaproteobacteria bacterium]